MQVDLPEVLELPPPLLLHLPATTPHLHPAAATALHPGSQCRHKAVFSNFANTHSLPSSVGRWHHAEVYRHPFPDHHWPLRKSCCRTRSKPCMYRWTPQEWHSCRGQPILPAILSNQRLGIESSTPQEGATHVWRRQVMCRLRKPWSESRQWSKLFHRSVSPLLHSSAQALRCYAEALQPAKLRWHSSTPWNGIEAQEWPTQSKQRSKPASALHRRARTQRRSPIAVPPHTTSACPATPCA
mmetsp:Transcript_136143/g.236637  ORF Transcript_136143/g.236637 Transcript_136143/m.236637 type:complete len:241 (-) Transcript_136143:276-998(-)